MHTYTAEIVWEDSAKQFSTGKYSRAHQWKFDGGVTVDASSSPHVVRLPYSREDAVDPEEAFVASVSSCHLLTFLFLAYQGKWVVRGYRDQAQGFMEKNPAGKDWVARIELNPAIDWDGPAPSPEQLAELHHRAHEECYIANSVKTEITVKF